MNIASSLGICAGIVTLLAYFPYVSAILKKEIRPSFISWPIWLLSTTLIFATSYSEGARLTLFMVGATIIGNSLISVLAYIYGEKIWTKLDIFAVIVSLSSLFVWFITGNAITALVMNVIIDTAAYFPTIRNIIGNPQSESKIAWMLFLIGAVLNIIVLIINNIFTFGIALFPVVYIFTVGITNGFLFFRRK